MSRHLYIAGASARSAAQSAVRAGLRVTAADLFCDSDLSDCCRAMKIASYPDDLLRVADRLPPCDWMFTGGLENHPQIVDAISARHRLLGNTGDILRAVRDPWRLAEVLERKHLPFPRPTRNPQSGPNCRWLVKPVASCGGTRIRFLEQSRCLDNMAAFAANADSGAGVSVVRSDMASPGPDQYFQPHIPGTPHSAVFLASDGHVALLGVTQQLVGCEWSGTRGFQYTGSIGPIKLDDDIDGQFRKIGACVGREFSLRGLFGIDTVVADGQVWTIEVNPRYTASIEILERAGGLAAIAGHRSACLGRRPAIRHASRRSLVHGKAIVYALKDVVIGRNFHTLLARLGQPDRPFPAADVPQIDSKISEGHPVLTVFAKNATIGGVLQRLQRLATHIYKMLTDCDDG